jgi:hypothetical protein
MGASVRAIRFSPLDAMIYTPQGVIGFGDLLLGPTRWSRRGRSVGRATEPRFQHFVRVALGAAARGSDGSTKQKSPARGY